mgnify:CR=1 FL=1
MGAPKFILKNPITIETPTGVISIVDSNAFESQAFFLKSDKNVELKIGQAVATSSNVQFSNVTSSKVVKVGNLFLGQGFISSSTGLVSQTGSMVVTQELTGSGNMTLNGRLTATKIEASVSESFTLFESGSSIFGDTTNDKHMLTGSVDVTGSFKLNGYQVNEISNDTAFSDGSSTALATENAVKQYFTSTGAIDKNTYIRKSFAHTGSITNSSTASFNAITASAPSGLTTTSEEDFMFFVNGMLIEGDALTIQQKTSTNLELRLNTSGLGYSLESGDEVVGFGKFNS